MFSSQNALGTWLDSESNYRLTVQKVEQAQDGADYARNQYEKYNTALQEAQHTLNTINMAAGAQNRGRSRGCTRRARPSTIARMQSTAARTSRAGKARSRDARRRI